MYYDVELRRTYLDNWDDGVRVVPLDVDVGGNAVLDRPIECAATAAAAAAGAGRRFA